MGLWNIVTLVVFGAVTVDVVVVELLCLQIII